MKVFMVKTKNKLCGVYALYNTKTNEYYIGSSIDIRTRLNTHMRSLRSNRHYNYKLQNAYNEGGVFVSIILELCSLDEVRDVELYHMLDQKPFYNIATEPGKPTLNIKRSEITKQKIREASIRNNNGRYLLGHCSKKIKCSNNLTFASLTEASRHYGISVQSICDNLKGRSRKTRKGVTFEYT